MKSLIYKNSMKAFGLLVSLLICSCSFLFRATTMTIMAEVL